MTATASLRRYRADRLISRDYDALRRSVLRAVGARLAAHRVELDEADLEACYSLAWQGLYNRMLAGEQIASPSGWLVLVTFRRAIDEWRLSHPDRHASPGAPAASVWPGPAPPEQLDDLARLRHVFEALRGRLDARECQAATLCYLQGLSRAEAAARLGISARRMRKLMEGEGGCPGVAGKVAQLLETIRGGRWCEQQASLMRGYAFGLLDPAGERHRLAVLHQRECPGCRAYVASLRGLGAIMPPGVLPFSLLAARAGIGVAAAGGGAAAAAGGGAAVKLGVAGGLVALTAGAAGVALTSGGAHHAHPAARPAGPPRVLAAPAAAARARAAPARAVVRQVRQSPQPAVRSVPRASLAVREFGLERARAASAPAPRRDFGFERPR